MMVQLEQWLDFDLENFEPDCSRNSHVAGCYYPGSGFVENYPDGNYSDLDYGYNFLGLDYFEPGVDQS